MSKGEAKRRLTVMTRVIAQCAPLGIDPHDYYTPYSWTEKVTLRIGAQWAARVRAKQEAAVAAQ